MSAPGAPRLSPAECADPARLERFVCEHISPNGWPIQSTLLQSRILRDGLDPGQVEEYRLDLGRAQRLLRKLWERGQRAERALAIRNAYHTTLHNFEVLLRLLPLEWPAERPLPEVLRRGPLTKYTRYEDIEPVLLDALDCLLQEGVPSPRLARAILAAGGHDYGHTGGTDRLDRSGTPTPFTHEEIAERHVAKFGLLMGFPHALTLQALAGIRATTFYSRPGRARVQAANDFERRLTLADVTGCILPLDQWLTHVGVPVFQEKLPAWKARLWELPREIADAEARTGGEGASGEEASERLAELRREESLIIQDVAEWFKSERGFFKFIMEQRLKPVPQAVPLWGPILEDRIAHLEDVLAQEHLMGPLIEAGLPLLEQLVTRFGNSAEVSVQLGSGDIDYRLTAVLERFLSPLDG